MYLYIQNINFNIPSKREQHLEQVGNATFSDRAIDSLGCFSPKHF